MSVYYSDKMRGPVARTLDVIPMDSWIGLCASIRSLIDQGAFGLHFPQPCQDEEGVIGTDDSEFSKVLKAEIPNLEWPLDEENTPDTLTILDFLEFCHRHVVKPERMYYHEYFGHHHLDFNREGGQLQFREDINRILSRNRIAYELNTAGEVERILAGVMNESVRQAEFNTGDDTLDMLLLTARQKFLNPDIAVRKESLEKLWDAWERLKTLRDADKKRGIASLIKSAANNQVIRDLLDSEARALTDMGNSFHIRHREKTQVSLETSGQVDYLFHRMFSLVVLLLRDL